jgi:hypothetical protein
VQIKFEKKRQLLLFLNSGKQHALCRYWLTWKVGMKRRKIIYLIAALLVMAACGPSQRELAVKKINVARTLIIEGDTLGAIVHLDSVKRLYPKAEVQLGVAKNMKTDVYQHMIDKRRIQLINNDSLIAASETKFNKEKTEYDRYVQYNHKRQTFNRTWDRSFLQVHLDERGELYLSSNYMGKEWLNHTGIRVYDGPLQSKSERIPVEDMLNHQSDFMDFKWERVSYMQGKADSVIHFIAENKDLKLKCVFLGSRYYYILLENSDIQAVIDALQLSEAIKRKKSLEEEVADLSKKLKGL